MGTHSASSTSLRVPLQLRVGGQGHIETRAPTATPWSDPCSASDLKALTRAIVAGDACAFERFYDIYSGRLYRLLLVLARGNETTAREVVQSVLIKLARKFRVFETERELWAWLSQVARNTFVDFVRDQVRRSGNVPPDTLFLEFTKPDSEKEIMSVWLEEALASLEPAERQLVDAVYFERRSHHECSAATGTTVKAVESKLARIRARLRQFILRRMENERRAT